MKNTEDNEKSTNIVLSVLWVLIYPFVFIAGLVLWLLNRFKTTKTGFGLIELNLLDQHRCFLVPFNLNPNFNKETLQMLTVKATQPDAPFTLSITSAADSEGNPIPASLFSFDTPTSDNVGAVEIVSYDSAARSGVLRFGASNPDGSPNIANLTVNVLDADGHVVGVLGEQIAVTFGDVASFEGGFELNLEAQPTTEPNPEPTPEPESTPELPVPTADPETPIEGDGN